MVNFDAAPNKVADIELETTAKYQPRANLDIAFSSMDRESAILKFKITQNKLPLSIGSSNVKTHILLVHQNGSKVYAPLTITDPMNGIAQYKIENDMLNLPGKVTGQVYVTRRGKDIPDSSYAVVAERIFNFTIEKSLAWSFDGETKLNYIVEIDELMKTLNDRITSAIRAVENVEDYVSIVETAKINGLSDIEIAKTNSIADLNRLTNEKKEEIRSLGSEYIQNIETIKNGMDAKINEFNSNVNPTNYTRTQDTQNWQKYRLTQNDGTYIYMPNVDPVTLEPGQYQIAYMKNNPYNNSGSALYNVTVTKGIDNTKQIVAVVSYTGVIFVKNLHKGTDLGWKELTNTLIDSGWITYNLINGALSNTAYKNSGYNGFDCAYKTITNGNVITKKLRINGSNIVPGQVIAQLPTNFAKTTQTFPIFASNSSPCAYVVIRPNGQVNFYIPFDSSKWDETGYAYAELTWHD